MTAPARRSMIVVMAGAVALSLAACMPFPSQDAAAPAQSSAPEPLSTAPVESTAPPSAEPTSGPTATGRDLAPSAEEQGFPDTVEGDVARTVWSRWQFVHDGDYAAACALYSEKFAKLLADLAETDGSSCVASHEAGIENSDTYLAEAEDQERLALTPFFYVPSAIEVDLSLIAIEDGGTTAFLNPFAVRSLDPTEFADGIGEVPHWIEGQDYLKLIDGAWIFIDGTEQ